ncbi:hypothetical protein K470DRAFT_258988 [Piedraia hortae CBS 480.64]|uniref:Endoplasmic reticulum transmembrane protein n=1 Tax=Piedraia hortae CBS 480.64 TaxID=1314780 RepID=A0A6A7BXX5_9PEZI|nr:hypothetical protein K470DRAFT_258988 [Piedraia hortae CBS 480.64]
MKITFIFIAILWVDSLNRVYRVHRELEQAKNMAGMAAVAGSERLEVQARRFYSERNMYLTGFTLFLSLVLNRTYTMVLEKLRMQAELKQLRGERSGNDKTIGKLEQAGDMGEISRLREELRKRDRDIEVLKKQSDGLSAEYKRLGDQFHVSDGTPKKKV